MKYLWTEDTGAGLHFWKLVNQLFFNNELVVESKGSNQGLLDAVLDLQSKLYKAYCYIKDNWNSWNDVSPKWKSIVEQIFNEGKTIA